MSEKEKKDVIGEVVEALGDVVSDIVQGIESILAPPEEAQNKKEAENKKDQENKDRDKKDQENNNQENKESRKSYTKSEPVVATDQTTELKPETRLGYAPSPLPQAEESEEETAVKLDDKDEIEAAIAKARETQLVESEAERKDPLVAETLPALPNADAAKLYLQSPNRIFFYWNVAKNPFETLEKAFGRRASSYQLVTRLVNLNTNAESFAPAEPQGNWWYNVRSNTTYRIDLGFYAANRPFIRLLSSNVVQTPRLTPSLRFDTEADWIMSTRQFIEVLTVSGYSHDVLGVAFGAHQETGETSEETATLVVANRFAPLVLDELDLAELRWLLISLAAGAELESLRGLLSSELGAWLDKVLQSNQSALAAENVRAVLESVFGAEFGEMFTSGEETFWQRLAPVAVGASAIHFPEILFPKLRSPEWLRTSSSFENLPEHLRFSSSEFLK